MTFAENCGPLSYSRRSSDPGGKIDTPHADAGPQRICLPHQEVDVSHQRRRTGRRGEMKAEVAGTSRRTGRVGHLHDAIGWEKLRCRCGPGR